MSSDREQGSTPERLLVKLRPSHSLRAAESAGNLEPLYDEPEPVQLGIAAGSRGSRARWYLTELPAAAGSPWDRAHARVADRLGVMEADVEFVEPDILHSIYPDPFAREEGQAFALGNDCTAEPQDGKSRKALGPREFAWHLGDDFTQLAKARDAVPFTPPATRIAHLDTGYSRKHVGAPENILSDLERSFVDGDEDRQSAEDPDRRRLVLDNSGHGTGTIGILAGKRISAQGDRFLGGAPGAEIVPLRIADSVVLLRTSAFARALRYAVRKGCDVVSMSMGGLPSRAWREAVDEAYEAGVVLVCAAGNNFSGLPTRGLVYPARYGRVIAACGVMANGEAYADLRGRTMEGNYGPKKKMESALAAFTPNIPWARYGCDDTIDLDGAGTSSATPQIAAAAALWLEKYKHDLPRDWRRVEAVRHALFKTAKRGNSKQFGNGILRAFKALAKKPVLHGLPRTRSDKDSWAFLRVITGLGIAEESTRERMFNLELAQRWMLNATLQKLVDGPEDLPALEDAKLKAVMEAIIEDDGASLALRRHVAARYPAVAGGSPPRNKLSEAVVPTEDHACESQPTLTDPKFRRLRVYASDPSLSKRLATAGTNEVTLAIPWESLAKGPVGEYLEIKDAKESTARRRQESVDLNDPRLLAQDGWAPSEGNAQFHRQMVYAVAMKTIGHFEQALGRPVLWSHRPNPRDGYDDGKFVRRLTVSPHALRQANAYYSPAKIALEFGYFDVDADTAGELVPGSRIFTCLSHDVIAHETTHAILDGMYKRFNEPSNPDVLAFHEGFADVVALLQHFTIPQVLEREISKTRGELETASMLGSLAVELGHATGGRGALRDAIGKMENGVWKRLEPDPSDLHRRLTPHARGAVLVAAIFDAFLAVYAERTADLVRISTGGSGVLPSGAIHPDLVRRLAEEASKSANHVLAMCIRALDYLPPVDVTFFEYLRAVITADYDMVRDDRHNYRVAFVEAFRRHGIYPTSLGEATSEAPHGRFVTPRTLSVETLRWQGLDPSTFPQRERKKLESQYSAVVECLKQYADACFYLPDREELFKETRKQRAKLHELLEKAFAAVPRFAVGLGIKQGIPFEVHALRRALRPVPDGKILPQVVVSLTQDEKVPADDETGAPSYEFRGGSTLVVNLSALEVTYCIVKNIDSVRRRKRTAAFVQRSAADPLQSLMLRPSQGEPFAVLHALAEDDG